MNKSITDLRNEIKDKSKQLIELSNSEHDIDAFNNLFDSIQRIKQLADSLEANNGN